MTSEAPKDIQITFHFYPNEIFKFLFSNSRILVDKFNTLDSEDRTVEELAAMIRDAIAQTDARNRIVQPEHIIFLADTDPRSLEVQIKKHPQSKSDLILNCTLDNQTTIQFSVGILDKKPCVIVSIKNIE